VEGKERERKEGEGRDLPRKNTGYGPAYSSSRSSILVSMESPYVTSY